jgi:predicted transcriptional regulator
MVEPVGELEYLSRSHHRIGVLRALREPCDRATLREQTGASKATLSRVLGDFEKRAWVTRTDGGYRLTALGELLERGLDQAVRALETVEKLAPVSEWLPTAQLGFDLDRLHDSTVVTPSRTDSLGVHRRLATLLYQADHVRELTDMVATSGIDLHCKAIDDHGQTLEVVLTAEAMETVRSTPEMVRQCAPVVERGDVSLFRYEGTVPYFLALVDDCSLIGMFDDSGTIRGLIESTDPVVRDWTIETLDEYRSAAVEVQTIGH